MTEQLSSPALSTQALETKTLSLADQAKQITVVDQQTHDIACETIRALKQMHDEIVEHHAEPKRKAYEAHKAICEAEARLLKPVKDAMLVLGPRIAAWEAEQKRLEEQREREAREAAERQAEEELEMAAVAAEQQNASAAEVAAILDQPIIVPRPKIEPVFQRANGISTSTRYTCECFDPRKLCAEIAAGRHSIELIVKFDAIRGKSGLYTSPALNKLAVALKKTFNIPGCRAVPETNVRIAGGR